MTNKYQNLTTDIKQEGRLTADDCRRCTFRRVNGRLVLDALGIWWSVRSLLIGGAAAVLVAAVLWAWLR